MFFGSLSKRQRRKHHQQQQHHQHHLPPKKKRENKGNKNKQRKIEARELQKSMAQFAPFQVCVCVYVCVWVVVCDEGVGKWGVGLPVCAQRPSYNVAYA